MEVGFGEGSVGTLGPLSDWTLSLSSHALGSGWPPEHTRVPMNRGELMIGLQVPDVRGKNGGSPAGRGWGDTLRRQRRLEGLRPETPADWKHMSLPPPGEPDCSPIGPVRGQPAQCLALQTERLTCLQLLCHRAVH